MRMFQPCYELGFHVKATDELWVVGMFWQNDFDGDFALDPWLYGPVKCAETALTDACPNAYPRIARPLRSSSPISSSVGAGVGGDSVRGLRSARARRTKSARSSRGTLRAIASLSAI